MFVQPDIRSFTRDELTQILGEWGEPAYRADQLIRWLYERRLTTWAGMTNLPESLRARLEQSYALTTLQAVTVQGARDATRKYLWRLPDGSLVESVLIPANPALFGEPSDRRTLCVSTQVGCAYGCQFCASGLEGWKRNLGVEEIVEQVLAVERAEGGVESVERVISNLVIMGMGEPLANYESLLKALHILNAPWGGGIGARKITISTSGLAPQIRRLAGEPYPFRLAISLHGPTDEVRGRLMPINRKYPLSELMAACAEYVERKGHMITFEYILIEGVNDAPGLAEPLAAWARRLRAKVNLIPYNTVEGLPWKRPAEPVLEAFCNALQTRGVPVTLRREKGHDIEAACGQLRLRTERDLRSVPKAE